MAHVLSLIYGSVTVALASGDYRIRSYEMRTPDDGALSIVESAEIEVNGSTIAALQANVQAINKAFAAAKRRREGKSWDRLFINILPDGYTITYRSEILHARLLLPESWLSADWANKQLVVTLIWERLPFWEAADWIPLTMTNANDLVGSTSGIHIFNCNDLVGSSPNVRTNIVNIAAASVVGDLPGPTRIMIQPSQDINGVYMGLQVGGSPLSEALLGSNLWSIVWSGGGSTDSDADWSGGSALHVDLAALTTTWENLFSCTVGVYEFAGREFRPILRTKFLSSENAYKIIASIGSQVIGETAPIIIKNTGRYLHPMGLIRIPSYPYVASNAGVTLTLAGKDAGLGWNDADGLGTDFDVLYLVGTDGYVEIGRDDTLTIGAGWRIWESWDIEGQSFVTTIVGAGGYRFCNVRSGNGIYLQPGNNQFISFLMRNNDDAPITYDAYVAVSYKPRRITL